MVFFVAIQADQRTHVGFAFCIGIFDASVDDIVPIGGAGLHAGRDAGPYLQLHQDGVLLCRTGDQVGYHEFGILRFGQASISDQICCASRYTASHDDERRSAHPLHE